MREVLFAHKDILMQLEQMEKQVLKQDGQLKKHERELQMIFAALKELLSSKKEPMRKIGFKHQKED